MVEKIENRKFIESQKQQFQNIYLFHTYRIFI